MQRKETMQMRRWFERLGNSVRDARARLGMITAPAPAPLVADTLLDELARIALRVDGRHRPAFLQVVEAAADAMERPAVAPQSLLGRRAS
jgi:hypothetical protein